MKNILKKLQFAGSVVILLACLVGVGHALRSSLFVVKQIEILHFPKIDPTKIPITPASVQTMAGLSLGKDSLFQLDLKSVEKKILGNAWIRSVHLEKQFPSTLTIEVEPREPVAFIKKEIGSIAYLDRDGTVFGTLNPDLKQDLPMVFGEGAVPQAMKVISSWQSQGESKVFSKIAALHWDRTTGLRAVVLYPLASRPERMGRALIDLGQEFDTAEEHLVPRLKSVVEYLVQNSISASQIWTGNGKKIVVKFDRGS